jgi:general secretion pathway protein M
MSAFWASRSPRERRILIAGAVLVLIVLPYWLVWQSLGERAQRMERTVAGLYEDVAWMQAAAQRVGGLRAGTPAATPASGDRSPLSVIDRTAREGPLSGTVRRVQPEGTGTVRVWLEDAPFDDVVLWLGTLERDYGLRVTSLVVDRQPTEGRVSARLSLERDD